ncbi:MAG: DUF167 domain-containing protein [Hyphomicrobiaceae bacterium]
MPPAGDPVVPPWTAVPGGVLLRVHLSTKASRDGVEGLVEGPEGRVLKVRVRAVPEKGAANAALARTVAEWLGVAKSTIRVTAGEKSRWKTVGIDGPSADIEKRLMDRTASPEA